MMDNPDIFLDTCSVCMGSGETGLGFYQRCEACGGSGSQTPPTDQELRDFVKAQSKEGSGQ